MEPQIQKGQVSLIYWTRRMSNQTVVSNADTLGWR